MSTTSTAALPIPISKKTFKCLTSPVYRPMPEAPMPQAYRDRVVMRRSACKGYYMYVEPDVYTMICIPPTETSPDGLIISIWGRKVVFSNFLCNTGIWWDINGKNVSFKNAEQAFKAACVVSHMDPADDTSPNAKLFHQVLESVMAAKSPLECRNATGAIPKELFNAARWDELSFDTMVQAQLLKCTGDTYYGHMQLHGTMAEEFGIRRIYFVEAIGDRDMRWGAGLTVQEVTDEVIQHVGDADWLRMGPDGIVVSPFPGKNLMGAALTKASETILGKNFEFVNKPIEDYLARLGTVCPLFVYTPSDEDDRSTGSVAKRARVMSDEDFARSASSSPSQEIGIARTGSSASAPVYVEDNDGEAPVTTEDVPDEEGRWSLAGLSQPYDMLFDEKDK